MTPGQELDRFVSDKVMGYKPTTTPDEYREKVFNKWNQPILEVVEVGNNGAYWKEEIVFEPSTRIDHAWEVVRFMSKKDHQNAIWWNCTAGAFICLDVDEPFPKSLGRLIHDCPDKVPFAICLAALMAVGAIEISSGEMP